MAHKVEEWMALRSEWIQVSQELKAAYQKLDDSFNAFLLGKGEPVDHREMEFINNLTYRQSEARGAMDQFITEYGEL